MQTINIHYRVNRTVIERGYMNNDRALGMLDSIFVDHPASDIACIVITGCASPEGPLRNNGRLAEQRALALKNYILMTCPELEDDQIIMIPRGENWEGLEAMVEKDINVPYRDEVLRILHSKLSREDQKKRIITLRGGHPYKYLKSHILPQLRGGVSSMIYFRDRPVLVLDTVYMERVVYVKQERRPFYIALKTNQVYNLLLLPNLAVEVPFGRNYEWSVAVDGNWSWWNTGATKYNYHRIQMAGIEVRQWFGGRRRNPLNGWYMGLYGYGGDYDVRLFANKNSDIGQQSLRSYSAGLTAGFAVPAGRRINFEFGLGIGYFGGEYKKYYVSDCVDGVFPVLGTYKRNYFGLTKANISLVWLFGSGVNKDKGKEARR